MIVVAIAALREFSPAVAVTFYAFGLAGAWISGKWGGAERRLFLVVYAFNILFVLGLYYIYLQRYGAPYFGGGSDDLMFEDTAREFVERFEWWNYPRLMTWYKVRTVTFYVYLVSLLQRLTAPLGGFHTLVPRFFNAFLLAWLSIFVYWAGKRHFRLSAAIALAAAGLLGVAPIVMYVSAHTFRDMLVTLILFALTYFWSSFVAYERRWKLLLLLVTPALVFILWETRERAAQIMTLAIVATIYILYWQNRVVRFAGLALLLGGALAMFLNLFTPVKLVTSFSWEAALNQYRRYAEYRGALGEGGLSAMIYSAPLYIGAPLRLVYLSLSPLPIFSSQIERNLLSLGALAQALAIPFLVLGLLSAVRRRMTWPYLFMFITLFLSVGIVTFTIRHILMYYPFGMLFVGYGYETVRKRSITLRWVYLAFYFLALVAVTAYFMLKGA